MAFRSAETEGLGIVTHELHTVTGVTGGGTEVTFFYTHGWGWEIGGEGVEGLLKEIGGRRKY